MFLISYTWARLLVALGPNFEVFSAESLWARLK